MRNRWKRTEPRAQVLIPKVQLADNRAVSHVYDRTNVVLTGTVSETASHVPFMGHSLWLS